MSRLDAYELEVLKAFEKGKLKSVATKSELEKLKAAAIEGQWILGEEQWMIDGG